jgi:hypothetical protein
MQQPSFEQMNKFFSHARAAMQDYDQISTRFWKKWTEQQLEFLQLCNEYGEREFELWANVKGVPELLAGRLDLAIEFGKKFAERSGAALASFAEAGTEAMRGFEVFKDYWTPAPAEEGVAPPAPAPKAKKAGAA